MLFDSDNLVLKRMEPNPRFKPFSHIFKDLLKLDQVPTDEPVISIILSQDSTKAITLTKVSELDEVKRFKMQKEYFDKNDKLVTCTLTDEQQQEILN